MKYLRIFLSVVIFSYVRSSQETNITIPSDDDISSEKRLIKDLFERYHKCGVDGRPVRNTSHPVNVGFGLGLIKLELMEKENMLYMSTWTRFRWRDEYLQWDPQNYGGVEDVKITVNKIWTPDVMLYNTADTEESVRAVQAIVSYDGTVLWFPHKVFHSSCAIDVRNFPFDNQTCYLWFGSWTHPLHELNLDLVIPAGIDLSTFRSVYKDASEWEIYNTSAEKLVEPPEGFPQFAILSFTLELKRKMMFSTYILTMPAIFLSFLTLLVFWLPPEHADKSALGLTIFGSLLLLLLILVEAAPPTASAIPLLGVYYCFTTVIVILSIFLSSLVLKVGKGGGRADGDYKPVPKWAKILFVKGLAKLLCLNTSSCCLRHKKDRGQFNGVESHVVKDAEPHLGDSFLFREVTEEDESKFNGKNTAALRTLEKRLKTLNSLLTDMIKKHLDKDTVAKQKEYLEREWRFLAMVLDRLFFIIYLTVIIISLTLLFPRSRYNFM